MNMSEFFRQPLSNKPYIVYRKDSDGADGFYTILQYCLNFPSSPWTHLKHYATSGFEGILAVPSETKDGIVNILTLDENVKRMMRTMEHMHLKKEESDVRSGIHERFKSQHPEIELKDTIAPVYLDINPEILTEKIYQTVQKNFDSGAIIPEKLIYIRPLVGRGEKYTEEGLFLPALGVASLGHEVFLEISSMNVDSYLSTGGKEVYPRVLVWEGNFSETGVETPARHIKTAANYAFGGMAKNTAVMNGFHETLIQDNHGNAIEGGGENLYMVKRNKLITPPLTQSILPGTKRKVVLEIAKLLGIEYEERPIPLEELFSDSAHAMAFSGTWTGFAPVEYLYQDSKNRVKQFNVNNEIIGAISGVYENIIHDRQVAPEFQNLQNKVLHSLKYK